MEVSRGKHPNICPCLDCRHVEDHSPYDPILHVDRSLMTRRGSSPDLPSRGKPMGRLGWLSGSRMGQRITPYSSTFRPLQLPRSDSRAPLLSRLSALWTTIKCKHGLVAGTCTYCPTAVVATEPIRTTIAPGTPVAREADKRKAPEPMRIVGFSQTTTAAWSRI